ncbi:MAG TPA: ROK family transcriptional regulator [Vicinamibacteria bacterium]|nr:ROK family transcriptional regulator [Vicinamibacteria bacterium]
MAAAPPSEGLAFDARHAGHLRTLNLERVLAVAMDRPAALTRQELGDATALSAPTISILTADLLRRGLLRDIGTAPSRGGRRAHLVEFNAGHAVVLGIDLGSVRTLVAAADLRGEILARRTMATPAGAAPSALLARVAAAARSLLRESPVAGSPLAAVAAAAPGAVDRQHGMVLALAPNLEGWENVPMAEALAVALRAPVFVENDVNLAVLGERWRGAARGHDTCAFLSVGDGIGAGIVIGGELHRGHHSLAGEIGLMCPAVEHVDRSFGARGALETLVGTRALAQAWKGSQGGPGDQWIGELFAAARGGDRDAERSVRQAGVLLGMATLNLALVIDPSLIVFGGPLAGAESPLLEEARRIVTRLIPSPPEMVASALGDDATLWGCLLTAAGAARARLRESLRGEGG